MDFFEALEKRHSVRSFSGKEIEEEKLEKIMRVVEAAPSAGNLKAFKHVLVREEAQKRKLAEACVSQGFVAEAPLALVFFALPEKSSARYGKRGEQLYSVQDATIACCYAMLSAAAQGIGSCWVGAFDEASVRKACNEEQGNPVAVLSLGYEA